MAVYATSACLCALFHSHALAFSLSTASISRTSILPLKNNRRRAAAATAAAQPRCSTELYNLFPKDDFDKDDFLDDDDDEFESEKYDPAVAAQIRKAKQMVKDAKRKQKAREDAAAKAAADGADGTSEEAEKSKTTPFFATRSFTASAADASRKIKSKTKTGEVIADGETMASLSKSEPWERRSLSQMAFQREARADFDGNMVEGDDEIDGSVLADRDLARSIYGLRKQLQNEDFVRVFDKRNRFIGEVD